MAKSIELKLPEWSPSSGDFNVTHKNNPKVITNFPKQRNTSLQEDLLLSMTAREYKCRDR